MFGRDPFAIHRVRDENVVAPSEFDRKRPLVRDAPADVLRQAFVRAAKQDLN